MAASAATNPAAAPILPGATLGVLGSGQLGKMFAMAAARLGYRVHVYAPEHDAPAADVAYRQTVGSFDDEAAVAEFAQSVDVVTLEFENISAAAIETAAKFAPVRPGGRVLHTTQERLREKGFLRAAGIPCTPFAEATTKEQLTAALAELGLPAVLKTAAWGYDGKGQALVRSASEAEAAHAALNSAAAILEGWVDFECEVSMLAARSANGEEAFFGPIANDHAHHILDVSVYPQPRVARLFEDASKIAQAVVRELDVVGLLCVEFFLTRDGRLLVNEIAPRPHNSGHLTIDACNCSQFEQQVRAVCGLPLGSFETIVPAAAMANLLGDVWSNGEPRWEKVLADPQLRLHLYGKAEARPGRKMGHLTAIAGSAEEAVALVREGREALMGR
ncbi:5-(carboxyamino)imidazole ribonucleotide synthase [Lacipirellula parvula]|uniref:N5-carboxyaminoimidazole ribonucleotide synthase n=1 Tax=Lacipirellula parvula TaxID=2650471 RepID=A0A5K7X1W2_9BACT|nr:5-(carboxyamino)imidazole ribonucleotide synthase [Lacipirellula parvula]BBO30648.1 N5-carboxyaminoimidazole ribonucleotide synthase [Lacipirellula parvula]